MRPVERGPEPTGLVIRRYRDAFPHLAVRIGMYCSYCERELMTSLAVEHIQPKAIYEDLEIEWSNFLLGCTNCNSTKGDKDVDPERLLLPDRDNTFKAFRYREDGLIEVDTGLDMNVQEMAKELLELVGLAKRSAQLIEYNERTVAVEREGQRMNTFLEAKHAKERLERRDFPELREQIVDTAKARGFFSIWMTVFGDDRDMRLRLINGFPNTAPDCFNDDGIALDALRPRNDDLLGSGKL